MLKSRLNQRGLKKRHEFLRIQRSGFRCRGQFLTFSGQPVFSPSAMGRFGLVTPKKIGKAHDRNKIKRRLRHLIALFPQLIAGRDVVILATDACVEAKFDDLKTDFVAACVQLDSRKNSRKDIPKKSRNLNNSMDKSHVYRVSV